MGEYNGMVYVYDEEDSLAHYGILGQKWGIRRFQNEDGTLTDAGKKRYGSNLSEVEKNLDSARQETTKYRRKVDKDNSHILLSPMFPRHHKRQLNRANKKEAELESVYENLKRHDDAIKEAQKYENGEFDPRERWGSKNSTLYEGEFERNAYSSTANKKLMKRLKSIINKSDDPEIQETKKLGDQYSDAIHELNDAFDKFDTKYSEEHGPFDGDGTEAHWKFEETYPEYKQICDKFYKTKAKFIDSVTKLAESGKFDFIQEFNQYKDCFDEIQDPKTGEYWYKHASAKTFPIAVAMSDNIVYDLFPQVLIESYDSKGNVLFKPWQWEA